MEMGPNGWNVGYVRDPTRKKCEKVKVIRAEGRSTFFTDESNRAEGRTAFFTGGSC